MSEPTTARPARTQGFMAELDQWIEENVIDPLSRFDPLDYEWDDVHAAVKKAIRAKVLESYHTGQQAPARREGGRYGR
jgi:hypothetical protein